MEYKIVNPFELKNKVKDLFVKLNMSNDDAEITADVLVEADLRGIYSHGVARLKRYVDGINSSVMIPNAKYEIIKEKNTTALIDAKAGMGQPVSYYAMKLAIEKAKNFGVGIVSVKNSNHYGIAGYYAMMASKENLIGVSLTNSDVLVVPTFGKETLLGTNPISISIPSNANFPLILDMATSIIPRGKVEVYSRKKKLLENGWAVNEYGLPTNSPDLVLNNFNSKINKGGLLPLGGFGEIFSGHKGYGLSFFVDILTGVLSGSAYSKYVYPKDENGNPLPANLGHFFMAIDVGDFRDLDEFKKDIDDYINLLKNSEKAEGHSHIYIHGEKEYIMKEKQLKEGLYLETKVVENINSLFEKYNIELLQLKEN